MSSGRYDGPTTHPDRILFLLLLIGLAVWLLTSAASGQAIQQAILKSPVELGSDFSIANSDYATSQLKGPAIHGLLNFSEHYAASANFRHLGSSVGNVSENTLTFGIRAHTQLGPVTPYIEAVAGEGVLHLPSGSLAGNTYAMVTGGGGGGELTLPAHFALHAAFEYQRWPSLVGFSGLNARVESFGLLYRIPPDRGRER